MTNSNSFYFQSVPNQICSMILSFPTTVILPANIVISLPTAATVTGFVVRYNREELAQDPLEEEEPDNLFTLRASNASTNFAFTNNIENQLIQNVNVPDLQLVPFLFKTQHNNSETEEDIDAYVTINAQLIPQLITVNQWLYSGPFSNFVVTIQLTQSSLMIINTTERALLSSALFLTMVLGIIAVLHVLEFGSKVFGFVIDLLLLVKIGNHKKEVPKRINKWRQRYEKIGKRHKINFYEFAE